MNFLEIREDIVHADEAMGNDYTLCGVTTEGALQSMDEYDPEDETETEPQMLKTTKKVTCPKCAMIIRYCCKLGVRSIGKVKTEEEWT